LYPLEQWFLAFDHLETAWNLCPRPSWMLAAASAVGIDRKLLVQGGCVVAAFGLRLIPDLHPGMVAPGRLRNLAGRSIDYALRIAGGEMAAGEAAGLAAELNELTGNLFEDHEPGTPAAFLWRETMFTAGQAAEAAELVLRAATHNPERAANAAASTLDALGFHVRGVGDTIGWYSAEFLRNLIPASLIREHLRARRNAAPTANG
jgi:hypothetical protein